jgi:hypothetical protein
MHLVRAFQLLFFLVLPISCALQHPVGQQKTESHPQEAEIQISEQPKPYPVGEEGKNYVPGEILVKFRDGTSEQSIAAIQRKMHLGTIRVVSKTNLYLMKILKGSSVESVMEGLRHYKEVKYSEPNYIRTIH